MQEQLDVVRIFESPTYLGNPIWLDAALWGMLCGVIVLSVWAAIPKQQSGSVTALSLFQLLVRAGRLLHNHSGALLLLGLFASLGYIGTTLLYAMNQPIAKIFVDMAIHLVLVIFAHQVMLSDKARQAGIIASKRVAGRTFIRILYVGIIFAALAIKLTLFGFVILQVGSFLNLPYLPLMQTIWAMGTGALVLVSVYPASASVGVAAAAIGDHATLGENLDRAQGSDLALTAALWLAALSNLALVTGVFHIGDTVFSTYSDPWGFLEQRTNPLFGDFDWAYWAMTEIPVALLATAHIIMSIACVSAVLSAWVDAHIAQQSNRGAAAATEEVNASEE